MKVLGWILGGLVLLVILAAVGGWLYLRAPDLPEAELVARYGRPNSQYAQLSDGVRLHYLNSGEAEKPVIILVHGYGDNSFSWDAWTQALTPTHRVIAVDVPGHGLTAAPEGYVLSSDKSADLIAELADKLGIEKFAIAGNSMGGGISWQVAVRHPDKVSHLILVDAAGWPVQTLQEDPPLAFRVLQSSLGRAFLASIDNTPLIRQGLAKDVEDQSVITEEFVKRWAELQLFPGHRKILMSVNLGGLAATDEILSAIKVPTLILWGEKDQLINVSAAHKFKAAIPHAELIIYPNVGHIPQWEIGDRSGQDAAAFLARHAAG